MKIAVWMVLFAGSAAGQDSPAALSAEGTQLFARADFPNAERKLKEALALAGASDDQTRAGIFFNLAAVMRMESRLPEAENLYRHAIALRPPDSPDLARPLAGLALVQMTEGRIPEALENAERSVHLSGGNLRQAATAGSTLATLLLLQGEPSRAREIEENVAQQLRQGGAAESEEYVDTLANLASARMALGNPSAAEAKLREAEAVALRVAGPNHPLTATVWNNLGKVLAARGDAGQAEALFQKALAAWRTSLGPDHPNVACGLVNLAELYQGRKQFAAAERLYRQAIAIAQAAYGSDSLTVANYWNDLGAMEEARHHHREAALAISQGLAIAQRKAGPDHPDTARIAVNLAIVLHAQAKYAEACDLFEKAVPVKEKILGSNSAELARILRVYADSLRGMHNYAIAESTELRATRIVTHNAIAEEQSVN